MAERWPLVGRDDELGQLRQHLGSSRGPRGVAVFGEAGVGKTRLVTEAVADCRAKGAAVELVRATEAARAIPLGSFAHLVSPAAEAHLRDDLLHLALARLREQADGRDLVLAVDDAHLLDEVSVALLHLALAPPQWAIRSAIRVLLSVRTGEPLPAGLLRLWKDEHVARLDVAPLGRDATEDLVLTVLGTADVPASLLDRIWELSRGNVLFVRELITAAVERRERQQRHHGPHDRGPVIMSAEGPAARLRELVDERLRLLEPARRGALEVVAVGEQVPLAAAERLIDPDHLEALERRGLVEVVDLPAMHAMSVVQVAHPLYGEVLAAGLPRLRRRTLLRDLAGAVEATELHRFDRLRLARWRLESDAPGDPEALLDLAREALARLDHHLAERLANAAGGTERADAGLVVGEALAGQGRTADAEAVLAQLRPEAPEDVAKVAIARASDLFLRLNRSPDAFAVVEAADAALSGHPRWQAECRSVLAQMCMFSLRLAEAGAIADDLLARPDTPEPARVRAVTVAVTAWGAQGRTDAALGLLDEAVFAAALRHRQEVPYGNIQLRMARFQTLYWAGRVREMDAFTAANLGLDLDRPPPSLRAIVAGFRGGALLVRGRAAEALAALQRSCRALTENDWFGQRPLAEAMRARAAVFAGRLDVAAEALRAAQSAFVDDPLRGARTLPYVELSRAWLVAAEGSLAEATQRCLAVGAATEHVARPIAVEALHAAVRLGSAGAAEAVEPLERLAASVDGPFAPLALRHAVARAAGAQPPDVQAAELADLAAAFEDLGTDLVAAELWRSAANAFWRAGRGASASAAARRAEELVQRCGSPSSPGLEPLAHHGEELTGREREVAVLAARGRSSAEIAERLYLSVRTVDTHLHRIYRKLMVDGRRQLAEALGLAPDTRREPGPGT